MRPSYHIVIADSHAVGGLLLEVNVKAVYPAAIISVVKTGPEVLQRYDQADLLILNQNLAVMDGLELTRILRARGVTIPIVLLSTPFQAVEPARQAGNSLLLSGPEIIGQLIRRLPELLPP